MMRKNRSVIEAGRDEIGDSRGDKPLRQPAGDIRGRIPAGPLEPYLEEDERVLWCGQPRREGNMRRAGDRSGALTSFAWLTAAALLAGAVFFRFPAAGYCAAALVAVILFGLVSPRLVLKLNAPMTYYALTDRRALILIRGRTVRFRQLRYSSPLRVELCATGDGEARGTIVFITLPTFFNVRVRQRAGLFFNSVLLDAFNDVEDAIEVLGVLEKAREGTASDDGR